MLHSSGSMQHYITVGCKAGINKNLGGALIEVNHAQQYAARCHAIQVLEEWVVESRSQHRNCSPPQVLLQGMPFVPSHQPALLMLPFPGGNAVIPTQKNPPLLIGLVVSALRRRTFQSSWRKSWRHWKTRIASQMASWRLPQWRKHERQQRSKETTPYVINSMYNAHSLHWPSCHTWPPPLCTPLYIQIHNPAHTPNYIIYKLF